ncbi:conserved hypothetical protein [Desulfosarcina cetonica]|uniref:DUF6714 family protein n=1 Tax=Desulfosarcina cetonica TaxID=90730 RepID=UPI001BBCE2AC|nr:DUF6714 family protein [Desulfosarcina cetonica]VTR66278.1 conserved hypothetical protein [Desulfosarcina cetonica]
MKCVSCSDEYPEPEIIDNVAYFVCSSCGHLHEVNNYKDLTKDQIIEKIEAAFSGVTLGDGIGLFEAQAIDDYETEEVQKRRREDDEKINWKSIAYDVLQSCQSSLSFFDADGMRFHLPAYIIGSIKGEVDDPIFHLTNMGSYMESRLVSLNVEQHKAIIEYLTWCLTEDEYSYDYPNISRALAEYWEKQYKTRKKHM